MWSPKKMQEAEPPDATATGQGADRCGRGRPQSQAPPRSERRPRRPEAPRTGGDSSPLTLDGLVWQPGSGLG